MLKPLLEVLSKSGQNNINSILGYRTVSNTGEPIGHLKGYVFGKSGKLQYLVTDAEHWIFDKQVLFPVEQAKIRDDAPEIVLGGLNREKMEKLPAYSPEDELTDDYEREVFKLYFPGRKYGTVAPSGREAFEAPIQLQLHEERLFIDKHAEKIGDVTIRKVVETHVKTIEVPVIVERLIVEPSETVEVVTSRGKASRSRQERAANPPREMKSASTGEDTMTISAYREVVEVSKRKVPYEEVTIRKISETFTETIEEELKKEELHIENPVEKKPDIHRRDE